MSDAPETPGYTTTIRRSLTEPHLRMGVPEFPFLCWLLVMGLLWFQLPWPWYPWKLLIIGGGWFAGVGGMVLLTRVDFQWVELLGSFFRSLQFTAELVPWRTVDHSGVVRNDDGSLMRVYRLRGPDLTGLSKARQAALMRAMNLAFVQVPGHWSLHVEHQRARVTQYLPAPTTDPVLQVLDAQQGEDILQGPTFESRYFLTIRRQPLKRFHQWAWSLVLTRPSTPRPLTRLGSAALAFRQQADHLAWLLRGVLAVCEPLTDAAPGQVSPLRSYLHSTVSDSWHDIKADTDGGHLDWKLCDRKFVDGWEPMLVGHGHTPTHVALGSVTSFPEEADARSWERLNHLGIRFRAMTRQTIWHRQAARGVIRRQEHTWLSQEQGPWAQAAAQAGVQSRVVDSHATRQSEDADAANQEVSGRYVAMGHFTTTFMTYGATAAAAEDDMQAIQHVLEEEGFAAIVETEHTEEAFRAMMPGNVKSSVRKYPLNTMNLANLALGLKASWPGISYDPHLQKTWPTPTRTMRHRTAPPWLKVHTEGTTLLELINHVVDVGHVAVLGETGAGKSSLFMRTMAAWLANYEPLQSRGNQLDIGRALRGLNLCVGGQYDDLTTGTVQYQPLAQVRDPLERERMLTWLLDRCEDKQIPRDVVAEGYLRQGLEVMRTLPQSKCTLTELGVILTAASNRTGASLARFGGETTDHIRATHKAIKDAITYLATAANGLLDGPCETFQQVRLHTVELGPLVDDPLLAGAVMPHLQHRWRQGYTGMPVLQQQDEFSLQQMLPRSETEAKRDLYGLRKVNVSLMLAIHSLISLLDNPLGLIIQGSCHTRILLANPDATAPNIAKVYGAFGCSEEEIADIASMRPQGEYYWQQTIQNVPRRKRFTMQFRGAILACCGSSSPEDHDLFDRLLAAGHAPGPDFTAALLEAKGCEREAKILRQRLVSIAAD